MKKSLGFVFILHKHIPVLRSISANIHKVCRSTGDAGREYCYG